MLFVHVLELVYCLITSAEEYHTPLEGQGFYSSGEKQARLFMRGIASEIHCTGI